MTASDSTTISPVIMKLTSRPVQVYLPTASCLYMATVFTSFVLIALGIWYSIAYPTMFSPLRRLPQPKGGSWFMGHFWSIINEPQGQPLRRWINEIPHDGLIRYLDFFNTERIAVVGSRALAEVLVHKAYDFVKPPHFIKGVGNVLGVGLFLAEGDEHKRQRRSLLPAFSYRNIKDMYPAFWSKSQELVYCLTDHIEATNSGDVEIDDWISRATLDVIGLATFGHNFHTITQPSGSLAAAYRQMLCPNRWSQLLGFLSFFLPTWFWWLVPIQRTSEIAKSSDTIKSICREMIHLQRSRLATPLLIDVPVQRDILSTAIASGAFSDEELVDQLMTILAAGHESTTAAMSWSIYELCRSPHIQRRIRAEIHACIPARCFLDHSYEEHYSQDFEAASIDRCSYLQAFCTEILRLYPPIPLTMRVAARDTSITGTFIPKDTTIILTPWAVNTSKETWGADAHLFKPERWLLSAWSSSSSSPKPTTASDASSSLLPELAATRPTLERQKSIGPDTPYAFLTFLHGPRSCIGQAFARAELACLVAAWVTAFETGFAIPDEGVIVEGVNKEGYVAGVEVVTGISARPGNLKVKIKKVGGDI